MRKIWTQGKAGKDNGFQRRIQIYMNIYYNLLLSRSLQELFLSKDTLKGFESQRLRSYCTSQCMEPTRDLDSYGRLLLEGDLSAVKAEYRGRVQKKLQGPSGSSDALTLEVAEELVAQDLASLHWGPTRVPIYNLLGLFSLIVPSFRPSYIGIAKFFIDTAKVPVHGKDLSGTTALSHSFSTKPAFDLEYAQILYDAGGDVNHRNRYGGYVAQEIVQVYDPQDSQVVRRAMDALEWFLTHGGSVDILDGDGVSAGRVIRTLKSKIPGFSILVEKESKKRMVKGNKCCTLCGREGEKLMLCSKCKKARYCHPQMRVCQKLDWPGHKKGCKA